jgi:NAD(P)-dependent dehydrogenase (short-subunit alcohol dehydrogenase family)
VSELPGRTQECGRNMSEPKGLLPERVVLISGGTAGLGAGIARAAAREGATVAVTGRRREPGEALAAELSADGPRRCSYRPTWPTWPRREPAWRR